MVWGCATAGELSGPVLAVLARESDRLVFAVLARGSERHMSQFNAQGICDGGQA